MTAGRTGIHAGYDVAMAAVADVRIPIYPLTVEIYERLVDADILGEDDRVEPLNGLLSEKAPSTPEHAAIAQWLATLLIRGIHDDVASVRMQLPVRLPPVSEPEPDIAIVSPGVHAHAHPAAAALVIEIAVTSRRLDLGTKAEIYAAAGVAEYWVIDIPARIVHVHGSPSGAGYRSCRPVARGSLRPPAPGAPEIDVERLFALLD
jgi:Uma2 family endonuclease